MRLPRFRLAADLAFLTERGTMVLEATRAGWTEPNPHPTRRNTYDSVVTFDLQAPPPLHERHLRELMEESVLPADLIAEEGIRSLDGAYALPSADPWFEHPDARKAERFGKHPNTLGPGIHFPITNPSGLLTWQWKADAPRLRDGDAIKYESPPGARLAVYAPRRIRRLLKRRDVVLWVTEGVKKTLAGVAAGLCIVGLAGVDAWVCRERDDAPGAPLPDWDDIVLDGRVVVIAYDSDAIQKRAVQDAERRLAAFLRSRGATPLLARIPPGPDGEKRGLDDHLAAGGSVDALLTDAVRRAVDGARPAGGDGAEACQGCSSLREIAAEQKAELRLLRSGVVPLGVAKGLGQLVNVAASARSRGEATAPLFVPDAARLAGVGEKTMSGALSQVRLWQRDPSTAAQLPFRVEDYEAGGKSHVRLLIPPSDEDEPARRPRLPMLRALARLPRTRRPHGGDRRCPRHPDARVIRTTTWRCSEDDCGWIAQESATIGGDRRQDDSGRVGSVATIHGAPFVTTARGVDPDDRSQDDAGERPSFGGQDDAGAPLIPVSFVAQADAELAASPHRVAIYGEAEPDAEDDPLADVGDGSSPFEPDLTPADPADDEPPRPCVRIGCGRPTAPPAFPFLCRPCGEEARIAAAEYMADQNGETEDGPPEPEQPSLFDAVDGVPSAFR